MSDLLTDFKTYFIAEDLVETGNCFADSMPESPDSCVCIYEYAGSTPLAQIAGVSRSIQIVCRAIRPTDAKTAANSLYGSLVTEEGILNLTSERWVTLFLRQVPFKMKVDLRGRAYYGFNVYVNTYFD